MKKNTNIIKNNKNNNTGFIPSSFKFISSCIKTASSGVRSLSADSHQDHRKDQVLWAGFDRLQLGPSSFNHVLLLGYSNGFQVFNVEDGSNVSEIVSRRDDPVTFLQIQPLPEKSKGDEGFRASHPLILVVASEESKFCGPMQNGRGGFVRKGCSEPQTENFIISPTAVRFYSLKSHNYAHSLRFRSTIYMVRCSPRIVAISLAAQIHCFDALTLQSIFSIFTHPVPQKGVSGVNVGYGPMAVGPRWLAYASNNPLSSNTCRLSPKSLTPSPGVSPSTSPSSGNLVARYAMGSGRQLAAGLINLGDTSYKTLSKYYQEFIPDGSSPPVSPNSSRIVGQGMPYATDADAVGLVAVKDFVSGTILSQFRAHTSQISALSFDPSGTLLVTASVQGSNINVFRIMPSVSPNGSTKQCYDWSSSHVHLYKLHRGITSAIIQDISFSHFSQWIAIVSSKGTCHIFALSPFGGETVLQLQSSQVDDPALLPVSSLPWWSASSIMVNQNSFSPPPPQTASLCVVSRIKNSNSGWLNIVGNATSSAAGKAYIPSGAVASVFHCLAQRDLQPTDNEVRAFEHLLVYTPSGHVLQYKLQPSVGKELGETIARNPPGSPMPDEELCVRVEAVQWWDVCRRTDWPEREECVFGAKLGGKDDADTNVKDSDSEDNNTGNKELVKPQARADLYLSKAEVQRNFRRKCVWKNSKMHFYTINHLRSDENSLADEASGGEIEIEKIPVNDVEIRQKDLLPVLDHFHRIQPDCINGRASGVRDHISSSSSDEAKQKRSEDFFVNHSEFSHDSTSETESSANSLPPAISTKIENETSSNFASSLQNQSSLNKFCVSLSYDGQSSQEHYFELEREHCQTELVTDQDSNSGTCDRDKSDEDDASDYILGGVFDFSEEG